MKEFLGYFWMIKDHQGELVTDEIYPEETKGIIPKKLRKQLKYYNKKIKEGRIYNRLQAVRVSVWREK